MQLSEHLTLKEFTDSWRAEELGIDNSMPSYLSANALRTARMFEAIRTHLSKLAGREVPITLSGGYRCDRLNTAVGSGPGSDHLRAKAIDWSAPRFGSPRDICIALAPHISVLDIGQLIYEHTWVHTSWQIPKLDRNRILTKAPNRNGYILGIA